MGTTYTVTSTFATDTTAVASQVNQNFTDVLTALNSFDASNLDSTTTVPLTCISGLTSSQCAAAFFKDEDNMASNSATAVSSQQAIKAFVGVQIAAAVPDDDAFGSWALKTKNTEYTAATDGWVVAYLKTTSNKSLQLETPTGTIRSRDLGWSNMASVTSPVRKGDTWKLVVESGGDASVFWLPVGG